MMEYNAKQCNVIESACAYLEDTRHTDHPERLPDYVIEQLNRKMPFEQQVEGFLYALVSTYIGVGTQALLIEWAANKIGARR